MGILQTRRRFNPSSSTKIRLFHSTLSKTQSRWFRCKLWFRRFDSFKLMSHWIWIESDLSTFIPERHTFTFPNTLLFINRNKMLENALKFYFYNLKNVFVRFRFFKSKFINHLVVIHFRFSFKKLLNTREFLEFVASSSRNTENILTDKFLPNDFLGLNQWKTSHFKMAENLPETTVESNIGQSHVISN